MSKYLQSLKNKKQKDETRQKYASGSNVDKWGRPIQEEETEEEKKGGEAAEASKKEIDDLQKQIDNLTLTPAQVEAQSEAKKAALKEAPIGLDLGTIQKPDLPDATEGLAPDISQTKDTTFVTQQKDIKQIEPATQAIETQKLDVPVVADTVETVSTKAATPTEVKATTMDAALAPDFTQAAADLMEVPTGTAATLLEKVPVQQPQTVAQTASGLTEGGVEEGLSQTITTDPTAAIDQIEGTDLESLTNIADLPEEALVTTQLNGLLAEMEEGRVPVWAKPAVDKVNAMMASRGLNASTLGRDTLFSAIVQSALPLAESNSQALQKRASEKLAAAVTFKTQEAEFEQQMKLANLSNQQQAFIQERNFRQQTILSNQSATNAAKQFNATTQNQTDQFMAGLEANVNQFNAQSDNAMKQFNITEQNRINALNAGNELQAQQFEEQQRIDAVKFVEQQNFARESWNAANAQAVEQSNITWRRNTNTAATAAYNAANQTNVQMAYNMTTLETTQMWQQLRDEAAYIRTAYESEEQRKTALLQTAIGQESLLKGGDKGKASQDSLTSLIESIF